jgi:hypothetical protein
MDPVSAGEETRDGARTRRRRMRDRARSQRAVQSPVSDRYQTPEWLERSFVLPLIEPNASDVPSQPVPHHDDDPTMAREVRAVPEKVAGTTTQPAPPAEFARPPSDEIDFARVVRRSDLCRTAGRLAWTGAGLAGLALIADLLLSSVVVLGLVIAFALASVAALALRIKLTHAPVPRLQR